MLVPGTDGTKMSKSKGNIINLFAPKKELKKQIFSIITDSTPLEDPKDPDVCNAFQIYALLATDEEIATMRANYAAGGWGFGHTKKAILELILDRFADVRERFDYYMNNKEELDKVLHKGAEKAALVANSVLDRVRKKVGY
jgi:tryptophanyl-tRNA synthetase